MEKYLNKFYDIIDKIGKPNFILIVFILIIVIVTGLYQTFSLYTESLPPSLIDGIMTYQFILKASNDTNTITIPANSSKNVDITVTNESESALSYGLYYSSTNDNIDIGYLARTSALPNDNIEAKSNKIVTIKVSNTTSSNITITFGVKYGFISGGDLSLETGQHFLEQSSSEPLTRLIKQNAQLDTNIDFGNISSDTNGKGIYIRSGTEDTTNPIYYYRGEVDNNNVIFADMCFKIVRTTETGGIKLIYNGLPTDGKCNATGDAAAIIANKAFNSLDSNLGYVGYMYGYRNYDMGFASLDETWLYASSATYSSSTGQYTLAGNFQTGYSIGLNNYHYTCGSTSNTCSCVYYIYNIWNQNARGALLCENDTIEDVISARLSNNRSSTIKGDKDTEGTIDNWYYTKIEQAGYSNYIEDTIWCNDRNIYSLGGWNPNGGSTSDNLYFDAYGRNVANKTPSLTCTRPTDRFTVNSSNGNGALDYPVGLITADEIALAGGVDTTQNLTYYLYSGAGYWGGSPSYFDGSGNGSSHGFFVGSLGGLGQAYVNGQYTTSNIGVRPSISLKSGTKTGGGSGTKEDPYVILTN